ncbi:MAG TPA: hypothetical protein VLW85_03710 [Myxococcales bacterium]|nr:hypothetical protein [Myxococcales bacterium]
MRITLLLLAAAIACGGAEGSSEESDDITEYGSPHTLPVDAAAKSGGKLRYYGGPVLEHPKVVAVFWGSVDPQTASQAGGFYDAYVKSTAFTWLSEYDTDLKSVGGSPGTAQHIGAGTFDKAVHVTPSTKSKSLTDAQIEKELAAQIKKRALPAPDVNTVYMIHFAPGIHIQLDGAGSCQSGGFCGYHSAFKTGSKRIAYAVLPDMGEGSGCDVGCGSGAAFDRVTAVASHELVEATTDPEVGLATGLAAPLAWYDANGGEIGDLCVGKTGSVKGYTVQKEWSNADKACVLERGQ